jgi:anti-sigma regulatory factor (Ser/Thr protein kinase)
MTGYEITVPNLLNWSSRSAEDLLTFVAKNLHRAPLICNMSAITFLNPYGVLLLLSATRYVARETGQPVLFINCNPKVYAYLDRVDFFVQGESWLRVNEPPHDQLSRNGDSDSLLEILHLRSPEEQVKFQSRARSIMRTWLQDNDQEISDVIMVLSEICNNAREHSKDLGYAMIQRYQRDDHTEVNIAVADLGVGINGSLSRKYGSIADSAAGYIHLALQGGWSARGPNEGGAGLQTVRTRIAQRGGELSIRSDTGLVVVERNSEPSSLQCVKFPGTQVSVKLRSYWHLTR